MTSENVKDLKNIADLLADDMKSLRDCLYPIQVELALRESESEKMEKTNG